MKIFEFLMQNTVPILFALFWVLIAVLIIARLFGGWFKKSVKVQAKVIDKYMSERTDYDMVNRRGMITKQFYTVCFDVNGYTKKFFVSPLAFDYLQKGMSGTLVYKGTTYIDFNEI